MMLHMRRVQIQFTDDQAAHLERRAAATGQPIAAVVRDAVDVQRGADDHQRRVEAALSVIGKYHSAIGNRSDNHDEEFVQAIEERIGRR